METTVTINNGQALLILGLIIIGSLVFGLLMAYLSGRYPFNKK